MVGALVVAGNVLDLDLLRVEAVETDALLHHSLRRFVRGAVLEVVATAAPAATAAAPAATPLEVPFGDVAHGASMHAAAAGLRPHRRRRRDPIRRRPSSVGPSSLTTESPERSRGSDEPDEPDDADDEEDEETEVADDDDDDESVPSPETVRRAAGDKAARASVSSEGKKERNSSMLGR